MQSCNPLIWLGALLAAGCTNAAPTDTLVLPPDMAIGGVTVSPPVSILAIGGTQQLSVSILSRAGTPLVAADSVRYALNTLADSARVRLAVDGMVTGLATSSAAVLVSVFAYKNGGVKGDQAILQVTASPIAGATLSIQPLAPDSAKLSLGTMKTIVPVIGNTTTGLRVTNPVMRYTVKLADAARMAVYTPVLFRSDGLEVQVPPQPAVSATNQIMPMVAEGSAWIYATVSAYGTVLRDSVQYAFSYPYAMTISTSKNLLAVVNSYNGQVITLAHGATVTFSNATASADPLLVAYAFDNPSVATVASPASTTGGSTGNVTALVGGQSSKRQFLVPGTYHWTATASGGPAPWAGQALSGTIVVK